MDLFTDLHRRKPFGKKNQIDGPPTVSKRPDMTVMHHARVNHGGRVTELVRTTPHYRQLKQDAGDYTKTKPHNTYIPPLESITHVEMYPILVHTVRCPYGVESMDWIALKLIDMYSELSVLCSSISYFCTEETCPVMRAGVYYEYAWGDSSTVDYANPVLVPAPRYIELLLTWIDRNITSANPKSWVKDSSQGFSLKVFCRRMFRVYAHIFCEHLDDVAGMLPHLRYCLSHFLVFMNEFGLLVPRREIEPLRHLIETLGIPNLNFSN